MRYANIGNYIRAGSLGAAGALGALAATQASSPNFADQQRLALNLQGQREALIQDLESPAKAYLSKVAAARDAAEVSKISYQRKQIEQAKNSKRKAGLIAAAAQMAKKPVLEPEPYDSKSAFQSLADSIRAQGEEQRALYTQQFTDNEQRINSIFDNALNSLSSITNNTASDSSLSSATPLAYSGKISGAADPKNLYTYMTEEKGMSPIHAKGLLANMIRESSLKTSNPGDSGLSDGLFQWHKDRLTKARQALGDDWDNPYRQIDYALIEPNEPGQQYLRTNFDSDQASADWWMKYWERPAHPERDSARHTEILGTLGF